MNDTTRPAVTLRHRYSSATRPPATEPRPGALTARPNVDTRRAAELIGMSTRTLEKWRGEGNGPPFLKLGRRVLYAVTDLEEWIGSRRRRSTSED